MVYPVKCIEWRRLSSNSVYHLFINNKSACSKVNINKQEFEFLDAGPDKKVNICKGCARAYTSIAARIVELKPK